MTDRPTDDDRDAGPPEDPLFGDWSIPAEAEEGQSPIFGELFGSRDAETPAADEPAETDEPEDDEHVDEVVAEAADIDEAAEAEDPDDPGPDEAAPEPELIDEVTEPEEPESGPEPTVPESATEPGSATVPEPPSEPQPPAEPTPERPAPGDPQPGKPRPEEPTPDEPLPPVEPEPTVDPVPPPPRIEETVLVSRLPDDLVEETDFVAPAPPVAPPPYAPSRPVAPVPPPVGTTASEPADWLSAERTVALPVVSTDDRTQILSPAAPTGPPTGPPTPPVPVPVPTGTGGATPPGRQPWTPKKAVTTVAAAIIGLFAVLYVADVVTSSGEVPRGVTVAGVDIGGMDTSAAEAKLRAGIEPRLGEPVALRAGAVDLSLDPTRAGLQLDWAGTVDAAGDQSLNPWTRLSSLFTHENKDTVTIADREQVARALEALRPQIDRPPSEGTIRFDGLTPVAVEPVTGQRMDVERAVDAVFDHWADGVPVEIPVETTPVRTTAEGVRDAVDTIARPAVSRPVTITGEGVAGVLEPEAIADALRFAPDGTGGLTATVDPVIVQAAVGPAMAPSERPGKDATFVIQNGVPVVQPSTDGRAVDWPTTLQPVLTTLTSGTNRTLPAVYSHQPAKLTTEQANGLGVKELVGEFTTGGFAADSGRNIRRAAEQVDGAIVKPGETFSLNGHTGPRDAAAGYGLAGIIEHGRPARGIGGGVSQFATTLYNASYFAGMVDVEHKEHSYYISRYPAGREATVFEGAIDLKFKNDGPTGIFITTTWTPTNVTVQMWGTKRYDVESITGERFNPTGPPVRTVPAGEECSPTNGTSGFSVTDTRVLREVGTGREVDRQTRTVRYTGQQKTICAPPPVPALPGDPNAPPAFPPAPGG